MKYAALILTLSLCGCDASVYGPKDCVSLDKSSEGTCVLKTNCNDVDVSKFEFAFDCTTPTHEVQRHSFGFGGFDAVEEFDTSVKCTLCETPSDVHHMLAVTGASKTTRTKSAETVKEQGTATITQGGTEGGFKVEKLKSEKNEGGLKAVFDMKDDEPQIVKYGPDECVSTFRKGGHCVMKTDCKDQDISKYEFGLICVDKSGEPTRHLFGTNSFDSSETFDTLIACDRCLGLDDIPDDGDLVKLVLNLTAEVEGMNSSLANLRQDVSKLKKEVSKKAPAPAPAPAPASAPAPALFFAHVKSKRGTHKKLRGHKSHHKKKHKLHHREEEDVLHRQEEEEDDSEERIAEDDQEDNQDRESRDDEEYEE